MRLNNNSKILFIFLISGFLYSEQYSILSDSVSRTFNAYFPEDTTTQTPMIILLHGLGGSNTDMEIMTDYFIDLGVVPVFPQGFYYEDLGTTLWNHGNIPDLHNDVTFISDIIDYMTEHYEFINHNRIYATGLSNGGYMSYRLACDLSDKITAVASVTGNFYLIDDGTDCVDQNREIPIMHIHGTLDDVVAYYVNGETVFGGDVYGDEDLTIMESIDFWTDYNNLTVETVDTLEADAGFWWYGQWIPTNSIKFTYSSENTNTQFVHIRVEGGGHFWFTSFWGYNWGFESHEEAYNFFMQYQLSDFFNNPAIENFTMNTFENYSFLSWDAIDDDNLNYYLLEKSTDSTFLENVESHYLSSNNYEDHEIEYDVEYFYRVAYVINDELSDYSETLSLTLEFMKNDNILILPTTTFLHQNYPNPFNPTTNIKYDLYEKSIVKLKIFNLNGKVVKEHLRANQPVGNYSLTWDGTDINGHLVPAGMYFYSIQTKNFTQTKKMVLLK